ncbi:ROK family transcriptional regulator [Glycomyces arizonensis]|uniref:ROK family transcriptional regulator n=1 Tax=Glycomyces arizonensis TaxID=256035 RepID=UPI0004111E42|nr:ROK family transcriptional regulator [Glycomyces arizonensis]
MRLGANLPRIGDYNELVVLQAVRQDAGISRVAIADRTGLAPQTVSGLVRRLLDAGLVEAAGTEVIGRGKPRTRLRIVPSARYALGVHLDPAVATAVLLDFQGAIVDRFADAELLDRDPFGSTRRVADAASALVSRNGVSPDRVVGLGVATPGPVDLSSGTLVAPPWLPGWDGFPLRRELAAKFGGAVSFDKDTTAALVGEMWLRSGSYAAGTVLFVYLGTGIGAALAAEGEIVRGAGNAGGIGHVVVDPDGPPCPCGRRGCLGVATDPASLVAEAVQSGLLRPRPGPMTPHAIALQFAELCEAADRGAAEAVASLERAARRIAEAVRMLVGVLDAGHVVFGGPNWQRLERYCLPACESALSGKWRPEPTVVRGTVMGSDTGAVGAAAMVLDERFVPRASRLHAAFETERGRA